MNFKYLIFACLLIFTNSGLGAQKYFTKSGEITFTSEAPLEKIEAFNNSVTSVLDLESGRMEFAVLIKSFHFEKALMEEHFNENYMESGKHPKSVFKGSIKNLADVHFTENGKYPVKVEGDLMIHGVTTPVSVDGMIEVDSGQISATSGFTVLVADYDIKIPKVVRDNIAKEVSINVSLAYQPLEQ